MDQQDGQERRKEVLTGLTAVLREPFFFITFIA